jgi:hypothetical protein
VGATEGSYRTGDPYNAIFYVLKSGCPGRRIATGVGLYSPECVEGQFSEARGRQYVPEGRSATRAIGFFWSILHRDVLPFLGSSSLVYERVWV